MNAPWPEELRLPRERDRLLVVWDDGRTDTLTAEFLRVESPSAEVQGHGPDERRLISGKRKVRITALQPVGHYAVRIVFDDGHNTGLYSWSTLRELADDRDTLWSRYLSELEAAGLSREA